MEDQRRKGEEEGVECKENENSNKMKLIEQKEDYVIFTAEIDESLANAIRRYVSQVPVLAVDEVEFLKNDSALYDETIAHRLGFIPIKISKDKKNPKISLSAKEAGMIYSKDLKGAKIVYENMPITFLDKGQELEIKATTKMGSGAEHSKFLPGVIFYRVLAELILDKEFKEELKENFPEHEIKERGNKIMILDDKKQEILDACESICGKKGKTPEINFKNELVIHVESFGQMDDNEIFKKSVDGLKEDLQKVFKKMKK